ncbi:chromate resistance protein ChrB domain-containing protein [uncultured Rhodoblastus sp.]|uniref:chromate resistance protein ChrB domain-containing protein n=1 Tax=uncultured Rhodoblastus sp. TaxID=543037 RepID=UPI0025F16246|nr:chromate resistance protein ChrB domain-containing protein [uncultured Rhodoblastus sp.]
MSAYTTISPEKRVRLPGSPRGPVLIDIRPEQEFTSDPRLIPGALRRNAAAVSFWGPGLAGRAAIVIGADTGRPDLVPEAAGLPAASPGLSRFYADDLELMEAGLPLYDAFYRWRRDATNEAHANPMARTEKKK